MAKTDIIKTEKKNSQIHNYRERPKQPCVNDWLIKQEEDPDVEDLNSTIHQPDLTDIFIEHSTQNIHFSQAYLEYSPKQTKC